MEGLPIPFNGTLKKHWRRRKYRRLLNATIPKRKKLKIIRLGGSQQRLIWRAKAVPNFHLNVVPALNIWGKLKDAYINMMLKFAGNFASLNNNGDVFRGLRIANSPHVPVVACGSSKEEEYESKMIFEIFKSLMAHHNHIEGTA